MKKNVLMLITVLITGLLGLQDLNSQIVPVGNGSYTTVFPGVDAAGRNGFPSGTPGLSGIAATKPVPTNDWWSDLIKTDHGAKAFNYPLSFRSLSSGLNINYTIPLASRPKEYRQPMSDVQAIVVGVEGLGTTSSTASDHSDWSVTMNWGDEFYSTINIGSPFVYFEKSNPGALAKVSVNFNGAGTSVDGNKLIIENNMNNSNYVVFAPTGSTWIGNNGVYTSTLNGKNYWSMVLLPFGVDMNTAINNYEQYAYVFPKNTEVDWNYNETNGKVTTTFTVTPDIKEGTNNTVLQGLLPHQWDRLASSSPQPTGNTYPSVRGTIKTLASNSFIVENTFSGILPTLPDLGKYTDGFDPASLSQKIDQIKNDGLPEWTDSYNQGQDMNRLIQAARIADQMGNIEARDLLVNTVKIRLEDWLSAESGEVAYLFYYNSDWSALLGYPAGHRQDVNLNDHHFHWGYFIHAAAAVEQFNPGWAAQWGDMINVLVRDAANPSRTDDMFPFLRNFSPYAGHSWANGFSSEPLGNDQESTSESMQFNSALIHWGTITNNNDLRDLGIYLYTTELSTIQEYWFDVEERSFQPEYAYEMVARVWASGYDNGTWWTDDVAASYGIQLYPIHGGSLYLGHRTDYVDRVWQEMTQNTEVLSNTPNDNLWYDTYWKFLSFTNPQEALSLYRSYPDRGIKVGVSDVQTYHWLHTMASLGQVAKEITADYPIASVFNDNGSLTYVAHNYGNTQITVRFSNGYNLVVPANSMATSRDVDVSVSLSSDTSEVAAGGNVNLTATTTGSGITKVEFYVDGTLIGTDSQAPYTFNSGALSVGFPRIYAKAYVGDNLSISNTVAVQVGAQIGYSGTPTIIPGIIEAGQFDVFEGGNGQGIAYSDKDTFNQGDFRPSEGVDASSTTNEGNTVGWIDSGEWLEYTINAANAGRYRVTLRYASGNSSGGGPFWFERDGIKISNDINVSFTGTNWDVWQNTITEDVNLIAGEQVIRVMIGNGGFNLGKMTFEYTGSSGDEVLTSIVVTPSNTNLFLGETQQYSAQGFDQYGNPFAFTPLWSTTGGAIDTNGLYTANVLGNFDVQVTSGSIIGTASVNVSDNSQVLTRIEISPSNIVLSLNDSQQFNAQGYDQNDNTMSAQVNWSTTGGSINAQGLYTSDVVGNFDITATSGNVSKTITVTVNEGTQVCTGGSPVGDYTYTASGDAANPTITFEPSRSGVGSSLVILYYGTNPDGGYPGYMVSPDVPFQINASQGQTVYFYYTYNVPEGGERNTAATPHSFEVGTCGSLPTRVLTSIRISPTNASITQGGTLQYTANGLDQFEDPFPVSPIWSVNGGSIDASGVYTGTVPGAFSVTVTDGTVSATENISVNEASSNCTLNGATGDFTTEISNDGTNPTLTFMPSRPGVGSNVLILYYGTSPNGGYPGYVVTPGQPYQINANAEEKIYFYYTYNLPEGGENNTSGAKNDFIVGDCSNAKISLTDVEKNSSSKVLIYPNPMNEMITLSGLYNVHKVNIYDISGKLVQSNFINSTKIQERIDIHALAKGFYILKTFSLDNKITIHKMFKN